MVHEHDCELGLGKAFMEMSRIYGNRDSSVLEWKTRGKRIIGCLGHDVPEEILIAAGYLPVRIYGSPAEKTELADRYLELAFDNVARAQFERIINGTYAYLDHLVISNSSDVLIRLFYYLRQIRRVEPSVPVSPLYFFNFIFTGSRTNTLYNRESVRDFRDTVEIWSGQPISSEALSKSISICNENRKLLLEASRLRTGKDVYITGIQALQLVGSSMFMPKEEHNRLLSEFLADSKDFSPLSGVRLYVTGSVLEQPEIYELIESCGAIIVGEDHDWGIRHFMGLIDESVDPVEAIADRYQQKHPNPKKSPVAGRTSALAGQVRDAGAQGVIFFSYEYDDASSWDYPAQKKKLDEMGIPSLCLDRQPYKKKDTDSLRNIVNEFVKSINKPEGK